MTMNGGKKNEHLGSVHPLVVTSKIGSKGWTSVSLG